MNSISRFQHLAAMAMAVIAVAGLAACRTRPPLGVVPTLDVPRFMGRWYVIACIPTWIERNAYAATETYERDAKGRILTTFTFRKGGLHGPTRSYHPLGFVAPDSGGGLWGMQFIWPIRADYRVMYVDPQYRLTLIGRNRRDYAWIMARTPRISAEQYQQMVALLKEAGYDTDALRRVPQLDGDG
ncbi:MAG TPA: lipocalin family protein [Steroidobacteraceae bacterium]|nr:lipocalin family protein [Steroidobacteraceae bacterium]